MAGGFHGCPNCEVVYEEHEPSDTAEVETFTGRIAVFHEPNDLLHISGGR